jgi:4'-phosphopantetheinyl transferase
MLLGRYLQHDPAALRFVAGEHGKPDVAGADARRHEPADASGGRGGLAFNLSHSGEMALYAFTRLGPVGIDLELPRRLIDELALEARALGPSHAESLRSLAPSGRPREFLRRWVRHEAAMKYRGTGVGASSAIEADSHAPCILELPLSVGFAALALDGPPQALRCWDWPSSS